MASSIIRDAASARTPRALASLATAAACSVDSHSFQRLHPRPSRADRHRRAPDGDLLPRVGTLAILIAQYRALCAREIAGSRVPFRSVPAATTGGQSARDRGAIDAVSGQVVDDVCARYRTTWVTV